MKDFKNFNVLVEYRDNDNTIKCKNYSCILKSKKDISISLLNLNAPNIKILKILDIKEV